MKEKRYSKKRMKLSTWFIKRKKLMRLSNSLLVVLSLDFKIKNKKPMKTI